MENENEILASAGNDRPRLSAKKYVSQMLHPSVYAQKQMATSRVGTSDSSCAVRPLAWLYCENMLEPSVYLENPVCLALVRTYQWLRSKRTLAAPTT